MSPVAAAAPRAIAAPLPEFRGMSSTMRPGYSCPTESMRSRVPSVEPSLTTMTSRATGNDTAWTRASTAAIVDASL